jgi:hypothetical protein
MTEKNATNTPFTSSIEICDSGWDFESSKFSLSLEGGAGRVAVGICTGLSV